MAQIFLIDANGRQALTAEEVCKLFGFEFEKIIKTPLFKTNKNKRGNNYLRSKNSSKIIPFFRTKHPETGVQITVRYSESWIADPENKNEYKYTPNRIEYYGSSFRVDDNHELAVWYFLNKHFKPKAGYEFVDVIQEAKNSLLGADDLEKALVLSRTTPVDQLPVLIKGLCRYITNVSIGDVDSMNDIEQRAAFRTLAMKNPKEFLNRVQGNKIAKVEGTILQLVDKGAISLVPEGPYKVWKWLSGPKSGQHIGDVIKAPNSDTTSLLIQEIISNPEEYKDALVKTLERIKADSVSNEKSSEWSDFDLDNPSDVVDDIISSKDLASNVNNVTQVTSSEDSLEVPEATMDSIRSFCEKHGFSKGAPEVALMKRDIESGVITKDTIYMWCDKNLKKKQ